MRYLLMYTALFISSLSWTQDDGFILERKQQLNKSIPDTSRGKIYIELAEYISDEKEWTHFNELALKLADQHLAHSRGKEKKVYLQIKANATGNKGYYFDDHGNKTKALEYYFEALNLYDKAGDEKGKVSTLGNIGVIFTNQGDFDDALEYLNQSIEIKKKYKLSNIALSYINIGAVYEAKKEREKALEYYQLALPQAIQNNEHNSIATAYNNIGSYYYKKDSYDTAIYYLRLSVKHFELDNDDSGVAWAYANIGYSYFNKNNLDSAYHYTRKAELISRQIHYPELTLNVAEKLTLIFEAQGDFSQALEYERLAVKMKDSLTNVDVQKEALRQKLNYEHEIEASEQRTKREEEKKREQQRLFYVAIIMLLAILFAGFIYTRLRLTKKQKSIIEEQKLVVEEKNEEIVASITYAQRLQAAIIPDDEMFSSAFTDSFVYYQPKDIVAGDFYWMHDDDQFTYLLLGDCTGHGVPGALVSVVCAGALDTVVSEMNEKETNTILSKVSTIVQQRFSSDSSDVKDGMDAALIRLDKNGQSIQFSGAMNSILIKRNNSNELEQIKGDRQPIGQFENLTQFSAHLIETQNIDWIYLYSDGYPDQFGGDKGKKIGSARFKNLLFESSHLPGSEQFAAVSSFFNQWKFNSEQTDDVCVIGIKLKRIVQ